MSAAIAIAVAVMAIRLLRERESSGRVKRAGSAAIACDNFTMGRMRVPRKQSQRIAAMIALVVMAPGAGAAESRVSITAGQVEFGGLQVEGLEAAWTPSTAANGSVRLRAARVRGITQTGPLSSFALDCATLRIAGDTLACEGGRLSGSLGSLGVQDTRMTARRGADGSLTLAFDAFAVAGGRGRVDAELAGSRWQAKAQLAGLDLAKVAEILKPWALLPEGFGVSGMAAGEFRGAGAGDALESAGADLTLRRAGIRGRVRRARRRKDLGLARGRSRRDRTGTGSRPAVS